MPSNTIASEEYGIIAEPCIKTQQCVARDGIPKPEPDVACDGSPEPEPDVARDGSPEPEPDVARDGSPEPEPDVARNGSPEPETAVAHCGSPEPEPDVAHSGSPESEPDITHKDSPEPELSLACDSSPKSEPDVAIKISPELEPVPAQESVPELEFVVLGQQQQQKGRKTKAKPARTYTRGRGRPRGTSRVVQLERELVVEHEPSPAWDIQVPMLSDPLELAQMQKPKKRKTKLEMVHTRPPPGLDWDTRRLERQKLQQEKEELEAVLLRFQLKKLMLEIEKLAEERERISVEKSNIALRSDILSLREALTGHAGTSLSSKPTLVSRGTQTTDSAHDEAVCSNMQSKIVVPTQTTGSQAGGPESSSSLLRSQLLHKDETKSKRKRDSTKNIYVGPYSQSLNPAMPVFLPFDRSPNIKDTTGVSTFPLQPANNKGDLTETNNPSLFSRQVSARPVTVELANKILSRQTSPSSLGKNKQTEVGSMFLGQQFSSVVHQTTSSGHELQVPTAVPNTGLMLMGNQIIAGGIFNVPTTPQHAVVYSLLESNENEMFILPTADVWGGTGQTATTSNSETNTHSVLGSGFAVVANPAQKQIVSNSGGTKGDNTDIGEQLKNEIDITEELGHEPNCSYSVPMSPFCEVPRMPVEQTDRDDGGEAKKIRLSAPDNL